MVTWHAACLLCMMLLNYDVTDATCDTLHYTLFKCTLHGKYQKNYKWCWKIMKVAVI